MNSEAQQNSNQNNEQNNNPTLRGNFVFTNVLIFKFVNHLTLNWESVPRTLRPCSICYRHGDLFYTSCCGIPIHS